MDAKLPRCLDGLLGMDLVLDSGRHPAGGSIAKSQYQQHYACMATITIRGLADSARSELAARAARRGQSMQEFVRLLLESAAAGPDLDDLVARIAARKEATGASLPPERIVAAKDDDRR